MNQTTSTDRHPVLRVLDVRVTGGFMDGLFLTLSDNLNCIIGARGTGKTTFLELVRFTLDAMPDERTSPAEHKRVKTVVEKNLNGGCVRVRISDREGRIFTVTRAVGEEPIVTDNGDMLVNVPVRQLLNLHVFSQNEVESIAENPAAQLQLIDRFSRRIYELNQDLKLARGRAETQTTQIRNLSEELAKLDEDLTQLPQCQEQLASLKDATLKTAPDLHVAHNHKSLRARESKALTDSRNIFASALATAQQAFQSVEDAQNKLGAADISNGPNGLQFKTIHRRQQAVAGEVCALLSKVELLLSQSTTALEGDARTLEQTHHVQEQHYRELSDKYHAFMARSKERVDLDRKLTQMQELHAKRNKLLETLDDLRQQRAVTLRQINAFGEDRYNQRVKIIGEINTHLMPEIKVSVVHLGGTSSYQELLQTKLPATGINRIQTAHKMQSLPPAELAHLLRARDIGGLKQRVTLNDNQAEKVMHSLSDPVTIDAIELVELQDLAKIELNDGIYKMVGDLSKGQKCTAILPILLFISESPLWVDQPEDHLDNRYISNSIVNRILAGKGRRQFVFITHNPNIPVLAEAEQVYVLESDGRQGRKTYEGDVDQCRDQILGLLEGGKEAFDLRRMRYERKKS